MLSQIARSNLAHLLKYLLCRTARRSRRHSAAAEPVPLRVVKYGGSVLAGAGDLRLVVSDIYRQIRQGHRLVAVVSAFRGVTDGLLLQARQFGEKPSCHLPDLLSTGETTASALLCLALEQAGIPSLLLTPEQIELIIEGDPLDGHPVRVREGRIRSALEQVPVVVVPGFYGLARSGNRALLGRGGSDLTAIFLASRLAGSECRLVKGVDGLYQSDPREAATPPRRLHEAHWDDAARAAGKLIQPRSLELARTCQLPIRVGAPLEEDGSVVGSRQSSLSQPPLPAPPLRVALIGLGNVGEAVCRLLLDHPELFELRAVAVRDRNRVRTVGVDEALYLSSPAELQLRGVQVLIELTGQEEAARDWIEHGIAGGAHIVTANKSLLVKHGEHLLALARKSGRQLLYSAGVGGSVPILETLARLRTRFPIRRLEAVLNGTCNYVLDRLGEGCALPEAVAEAQALGLAEPDPRADLEGRDAACKVCLLLQSLTGNWVSPSEIPTRGIERLGPEEVAAARRRGRVARLVGTIDNTGLTPRGRVDLVFLNANHPLARVRGADNGFLIHTCGGRRFQLRGRGAGPYPTAQAVMADLLDIRNLLTVREEAA